MPHCIVHVRFLHAKIILKSKSVLFDDNSFVILLVIWVCSSSAVNSYEIKFDFISHAILLL